MTEGQSLVAFYVDECIEQGKPEMVLLKGHMARRIKEILTAMEEHPEAARGRPPADVVKDALREFICRNAKTPLALNDIVVEQGMNESEITVRRPEARRRAKDWIAENGWPTGARFVRGEMSGTYVYDPLGTEPLPAYYEGWPHPKPTFEDVVKALS